MQRARITLLILLPLISLVLQNAGYPLMHTFESDEVDSVRKLFNYKEAAAYLDYLSWALLIAPFAEVYEKLLLSIDEGMILMILKLTHTTACFVLILAFKTENINLATLGLFQIGFEILRLALLSTYCNFNKDISKYFRDF